MNARVVQLLAILLTCGLLAAAGRFTQPINETRRSLDMMGSSEVLAKTPPEYAFAVQAFGAFRGLLTNIAFIRAEKMKEQGRYYDMMNLAEWICQLQPRFPTVWEFQSWNMAWNISITAHTPEERWNWVYNGVRLLRDQGLRYNPRAINLYKQLAWTFVNKMSETTDEYHLFFKRSWAWKMHLLLGPPPDPLGDYRPGEQFEPLPFSIGQNDPLIAAAEREAERRVEHLQERIDKFNSEFDIRTKQIADELLAKIRAEKARSEGLQAAAPEEQDPQAAAEQGLSFYTVATRAAYLRLAEIADAPDTLADLFERQPATRDMLPALAGLGVTISDDPLSEDDYWADEVGLAWKFFYRYRLLTERPSLLQSVRKQVEEDPDRAARERFGAVLKLAENDAAGQLLVRFLQKKVLREVYRMEPARMAELTARFGPMDWRMVDAHSLYWVNEGLIAAGETIGSFTNDRTNTTRMIFFSLRNLMNKNRMIFEPYTKDVNYSYMNFNPDVNFIEPMHRAYVEYAPLVDPDPESKGVGATYRSGHINFLEEAIRLLFFSGRVQEAARYYAYLRNEYGKLENGLPNPAFAKPLRDYVVDSLRGNEGIQRDARATINAYLEQAWMELTRDNRGTHNMLIAAARKVHEDYNREHGQERIEKVTLPRFEDMAFDSLSVWFQQPSLSPVVLLEKARLWANLPYDLRQKLYDLVQPQLAQECELAEFNIATAFPEPPGMAEYRDANPDRARPSRESGVDTPTQPR